MEGAEILWEQSHMWDESKVLSSCTGHGDAVIAPGRFFMFKTPPKTFPGIAVALSSSPSHVPSSSLQLISEEPQKTALPIAPGSLRIDPNTAQGCRKCIPGTKS